jgi:hypothetical protein
MQVLGLNGGSGMHGIKILLAAAAVAAASPAAADKLPATWDGLVQVKASKLAAVYLLPDADFRAYSQVMFDPSEVAFEKDWAQNYNEQAISLEGRVSSSDVQKGIADAQAGLDKIFPQVFAKEGFQVATAPAANVARISVGVMNLSVTAPDVGIGMGTNFAVDAGEATLVLEVRDSLTNQLLGRGLDRREAGDDDGAGFPRTSVSNREDFKELFETWATIAAKGLTELRASSPINTDGIRKQ